ncbi:MAG: hypothetical protein V7774_08150 [Pseudorhizobium pelagicum]|uniref:hypothetical protein n=1 Tax=Pseudorhizobium pelagicum TaxID=1509405 RepID=UPI00345F6BF9
MSKMTEFEKIRDLFKKWVETGVPAGVDFPRTQTEAVGWKCERFDIVGVGSKSYFKTTSPDYGRIVTEIKALIAELKPESEVRRLARQRSEKAEVDPPVEKREYKTQKARRHAAEDKAASLQAENTSLLSQLQEKLDELAAKRLSIKMEREIAERLRRDVAQLEVDNARLTRMLAARSGVLHVVE